MVRRVAIYLYVYKLHRTESSEQGDNGIASQEILCIEPEGSLL